MNNTDKKKKSRWKWAVWGVLVGFFGGVVFHRFVERFLLWIPMNPIIYFHLYPLAAIPPGVVCGLLLSKSKRLIGAPMLAFLVVVIVQIDEVVFGLIQHDLVSPSQQRHIIIVPITIAIRDLLLFAISFLAAYGLRRSHISRSQKPDVNDVRIAQD